MSRTGGYAGEPVGGGGMDPRNALDRTPPRKPIHTSTSVGTTRDGYLFRVTVATCDDGSLWRLSDTESGEQRWERLPPIPQQ